MQESTNFQIPTLHDMLNALRLNDAQARAVRGRVVELQAAFTEVMLRAPLSGGLSPLDHLASFLRARVALDRPWADQPVAVHHAYQSFLHYAEQNKDASGQCYALVIHQLEVQAGQEIEHWLDSEQRAIFQSHFAHVLLELQWEMHPLRQALETALANARAIEGDRAGEADSVAAIPRDDDGVFLQPQVAPLAFEEMTAALGLDEIQTAHLLRALDGLKDKAAEIYQLQTSAGMCPADVQADLLRQYAGQDTPQLRQALMEFLNRERPVGYARSYRELFRDSERDAAEEIMALLRPEQRALFSMLNSEMLAKVATGHDPVGPLVYKRLGWRDADIQTITLNELEGTLSLSELQLQQMKFLLDTLKDDFITLMGAAPKEGVAPIEYVHSSNNALDHLRSVVASQKHPLFELTYAEAFGGIEAKCREAITGLLTNEQIVLWRKISLGSLLLVQTGYDPFVKVKANGKQRPLKKGAAMSIDQLPLTPEQNELLCEKINALKTNIASIYSDGDTAVSPLERMARALFEQRPDPSNVLAQALQERSRDGRTYAERTRAAANTTWREIRDWLPSDLRAQWVQIPPHSLIRCQTGYDPVASKLQELLRQWAAKA